jgi:hypothetical protein
MRACEIKIWTRTQIESGANVNAFPAWLLSDTLAARSSRIEEIKLYLYLLIAQGDLGGQLFLLVKSSKRERYLAAAPNHRSFCMFRVWSGKIQAVGDMQAHQVHVICVCVYCASISMCVCVASMRLCKFIP